MDERLKSMDAAQFHGEGGAARVLRSWRWALDTILSVRGPRWTDRRGAAHSGRRSSATVGLRLGAVLTVLLVAACGGADDVADPVAPESQGQERGDAEELESEVRVARAADSEPVMVGEDSIYCIATAEQTGGGYSFLEAHVLAGSGAPQHRHDSSDEWFYILSGTASFQVADLRAEVGPGDYIHVPRDTTHAFNATTDMRFVAGFSPGGEESHLWPLPQCR